MKQRTAVRAFIRKDDRYLLLRRANGRDSILGKFELPGGKIGYHEQPEDALRRYTHSDSGVHMERADLFDVVTYIDHDDRDMQYTVIIYNVTIASGSKDIKLSQNYDAYEWKTLSELQQESTTDLTQLLLGIVQQDTITDSVIDNLDINDVDNTSKDSVIIFSDGGSRGNPGPSASGFVIFSPKNEILAEGGEYLGITTNNQAEYHGVRLGMEKALDLGYKQISFRIDSMLVVNQMNGIYKIKNRELWPIHERIRELILKFDKVSFHHVKREHNRLADGMVNKTLDEHKNGR